MGSIVCQACRHHMLSSTAMASSSSAVVSSSVLLCRRSILHSSHLLQPRLGSFQPQPQQQSRGIRTKNYYDVLELTPTADHTHIKAAYYRLSKLYHPDMSSVPGHKEKFAEIVEAYEVLGNRKSRKQYDRGSYVHSPTSNSRSDPEDELYSKIRNRKDAFRKRHRGPTFGGRSDIYDFDEFYRQHYGDFVKSSHSKKYEESRAQEEYKQYIRSLRVRANVMYSFLCCIAGATVYGYLKRHGYIGSAQDR